LVNREATRRTQPGKNQKNTKRGGGIPGIFKRQMEGVGTAGKKKGMGVEKEGVRERRVSSENRA